MPIERAKSVDRLYDECRGSDLVLVPDPPLASALNRRIEEPRFGSFATTPRRLAASRRESAEDRLGFLEVIEETDLAWKEAAHAVGNVLHCWDNRGSLESILDYDRFDTPATREVIDCLRDLDTTSSELAEYRIEVEDVAVVGIEEFTALERSILPEEYETVDPLAGEPFDRPPFQIYESPAAIVDTLLDTITEENADRVAIVLDRGSGYSPLVEAALEAADVPFYGGPGFTDQPDHRAFLRLLRTAHAGSDVRVADVRPMLERLGVEIDVEHDGKRLHAVDVPAATWLTDYREGIEDRTFEEALSEFESAADVTLDAFREELDELGLLHERATESAVGRLEFYLQSYEVPVERDDEGVLLADAKTAATVDRPAVFYLGMDDGWTHASPRRPWVDPDEAFTRNLRGFQRLLQNGVAQHYLVVDERGGRAVTPCLYFEELLDDEFERFSDVEGSEPFARTFQIAGDGFYREPLDVEREPVDSISQSGLNRLVNCPRDHFFDRLVDGPDRDYFAVGTLFHDFAEVYADHPDRIGEDDLEGVVDLMLEETSPFDRDVDRATSRTRFRVGLETIVEFLDANEPVGADFLASDAGWGRNAVAEHFDVDVDSPHTEWWFDDEDLGVKGKIDLVHSPTELVDYKSGSKDSATDVVQKSALDPPHDTPNFQALLYLTYHRSEVADERLQFTFFHFLETLDEVVAGEATLEDCLTTIAYHPVAFEEHVAREAVVDDLRENGSGDCRKTFERIDYDEYADVIVEHPFPDGVTKDELLDSPLGEALHRRASDIVGEYEYVRNGCGQALYHLRGVRDSNYFADDLDAFESFVEERLEELNRYRAGEERVPVEGLGGEPNYRRVDHRDMILEGDV